MAHDYRGRQAGPLLRRSKGGHSHFQTSPTRVALSQDPTLLLFFLETIIANVNEQTGGAGSGKEEGEAGERERGGAISRQSTKQLGNVTPPH